MKEKDEDIENRFGNLKKSQPFRIPEGYFETFSYRLMFRIKEIEQPTEKRTLYFYLKPALSLAASIVLVILLVFVPIKKFYPPGKGYLAQQKNHIDPVDSLSELSATLISYFSEGQFMTAVSEMDEFEPKTLSSDNLADYIAANYNEYDIIANN
jgi:hypothetical protein